MPDGIAFRRSAFPELLPDPIGYAFVPAMANGVAHFVSHGQLQELIDGHLKFSRQFGCPQRLRAKQRTFEKGFSL